MAAAACRERAATAGMATHLCTSSTSAKISDAACACTRTTFAWGFTPACCKDYSCACARPQQQRWLQYSAQLFALHESAAREGNWETL
jgi:hypothetical protein